MNTQLHHSVLAVVRPTVVALALSLCAIANAQIKQPALQTNKCLFNDSHFHLTNYIQRGTDVHQYLEIMGDEICLENYMRVSDGARVNVRAWEKKNLN